MKCQKKYIILFVTISLFVLIGSGCNSISSTVTPGINPNPDTNPGNSTVSYVKITPSSSTIKLNQSLQLVVKGYNSDDEWVILDKSKIKLWNWSVLGCPDCFEGFVNLSPKSGSLTTTFFSGQVGTFYVVVYYQEKAGDEYITDYVKIVVN